MYEPMLVGDFDRKQVLILGKFPINEKPFVNRNLILKRVTFEEAEKHFFTSKAIIVADYPSKFSLIQKCFKQMFPIAENYGLMQRVILHNDLDFFQIKDMGSTDYFYFLEKLEELAETISRHSCGPAPNQSIKIAGAVSKLDPEDMILLRRSFYDCTKIYVVPISGGQDAKHLLKIYAWMGNSEVEAAMLPYFMKISSPQKIKDELANYQVFTAEYISFQYRPNCRLERCVSTQNNRCLVGNFVDDAIPLRKALQDNYSTGIIHSLFEKTLRGFRRRPLVVKKPASITTFHKFIKDRIKIQDFTEMNDLIEEAKKLGLKSEVQELYTDVLDICSESCKTGVIHGDLHLGNVMVSGHDAIVIDFSGIIASGPLTADPATLEISICFDIGKKAPSSFSKWKKVIDEAYEPHEILRPLAFTDQIPDEFTWIRHAVREIRHILIGCDCCKYEIQIVIVCYLLRIARLAPKKLLNKRDKFEFKCRAYALVVAERIINYLNENKGK